MLIYLVQVTVRNGGVQGSERLVKQFFYADVNHPKRLTHFHNPKIGLTQRLFYDEIGHLIAIETKDEKMFVATAHDGSPILVYRADGKIVKEVCNFRFLVSTLVSIFLPSLH